ncbi:hypothetical protein [Sphingomonas aquatilis]
MAPAADQQLIDASAEMLRAMRDLKASGADATEEQDRDAWARLDAAEQIILTTPAVTVGGVLAKLRRAVITEVTADWVALAVGAGDVAALSRNSATLHGGELLLVQALCTLEDLAAQ